MATDASNGGLPDPVDSDDAGVTMPASIGAAMSQATSTQLGMAEKFMRMHAPEQLALDGESPTLAGHVCITDVLAVILLACFVLVQQFEVCG